MNYEFLAEARDEFWEAAFYYDSKETGLGSRFSAEVAHVIERILADPCLWRERSGGYRRVNCPVFPYYVAYFIRNDTILIAAIAHGHRKPGYWKSRTQKS
jgi:ParE-like toxin of type II ParDE toxin-antitoxin system